ncbi:hypothetical protein ESCAB7627_2001 [Escherichia albertii TW07627]|uniref:Uncharacterized protein n=1 Tax=Escherichia albertii (strain TW07627) TaxID=502347 RepID=A0ABC9NKR7_ESCAT|nr:hypothetical protein ESCAB7627_2001 [Escherichia albertii TW07627]
MPVQIPGYPELVQELLSLRIWCSNDWFQNIFSEQDMVQIFWGLN